MEENLKSKFVNRPISQTKKKGFNFKKYFDFSWYRNENILNKILLPIFIIITFIYPFFFISKTTEYFETPKSLLLGVLVFLTLILYGIKMYLKKKVTFNKSYFLLPLSLLALAYFMSFIFSVNPEVSFWSYNSTFFSGLFSQLLFVILFFAIINTFETKESVKALITSMIVSVIVISIFTVLKAFGAFDNIFNWLITANSYLEPLNKNVTNIYGDFNGDTQSLGLFLVMGINLIVGFKLLNKENDNLLTIVWGIILVIVISALGIFLNSASLTEVVIYLLLFIVPTIVLFIKEKGNNKLIYKIVPILLGLIFLSLIIFPEKISNYFLENSKYGTDYDVPFSTSWTVTLESFKEYGVKGFFLGTGQGTYVYNFSSFKPLEHNQNPNWNIEIYRSGSSLLDLITNTGVVSLLAFVVFIYFVIRNIIENKKRIIKNEDLFPIVLLLSSILVGSLISTSGSTIILYGVMLFAFYSVLLKIDKYPEVDDDEVVLKLSSVNKIGTDEKNLMPLIFSFVIIALSILGFTGVVRNYVAEVEFRKAVEMFASSDVDIVEIKKEINLALKKFPIRDNYRRQYSLILLSELQMEISKTASSQEESTVNVAYQTVILDELKAELKKLTQDNSYFGTFGTEKRKDISVNYTNWQARSEILRNLFDMSGGTMYGEEAIIAISKAIELSPYDPNSYIILGLLYEGSSDEVLKAKAEEAFIAGYNVQPGYVLGIYSLGLYLETVKEDYESARNLYKFSLENYYQDESSVKDYLEKKINSIEKDKLATTTDEVVIEENIEEESSQEIVEE